MNKKIVALFTGILFIPATAYASDVNIFVHNNPINTGGFISDDTTYVPLRAVSEVLGAQVIWDNDTRSVYIDTDEDTRTGKVIEESSKSVVAIVGNHKSNYITGTASDYNELTAHGTGVIIKSGGSILTNAHVISDIDNITVVFSDGESYPAQVQYIDKESDLAVVKVGRLGLKPITFADTNSVFAGQSVVAIGTPLSLSMRNSASKGIISGVNVNVSKAYYPLLQTDAAINGGNSGGPLLNMKGQLIGINSSKYAGVGIEGLSFSIPLDTINYVLSQFEMNGKVCRPNLGITLENSWEARIGLPTKKGVTVKASSSDTLKIGDVINTVNGIEVHSIVDFNKALRDTYSSGSIKVIYTRNGEQISTDIVPNIN
ncbi:MAG: trypsin-like serine protease [Clostridia bacterium]|nr:trypsin-like serine protease [Clostridia bacterium]MCI8980421.1 trypsin-like serine protease [Clostridia bacterium]MCI9085601.1 trypsin-like serine protease [Clostridia bacterium]